MWSRLAEVPDDLDASAVAVGVFDGVHRGHRRVIDDARRVADGYGLPLVLLTFDPHPARFPGLTKDTEAAARAPGRPHQVLGHRCGPLIALAPGAAPPAPGQHLTTVGGAPTVVGVVEAGAVIGASGSATLQVLSDVAGDGTVTVVFHARTEVTR